MRLGTATQLTVVHGKAVCTSPGVRLQRPLTAHNSTGVRGSVLGHSPDKLMQGHILDGSPTAESDLCVAAEVVLGAPEEKKEMKLGLTASDIDEEDPPLPPVGASQRPRLMSSSTLWRNSDPQGHIVATHGLENNINWI